MPLETIRAIASQPMKASKMASPQKFLGLLIGWSFLRAYGNQLMVNNATKGFRMSSGAKEFQ